MEKKSVIGGVCVWIASYLGISVTIVRIFFIFSAAWWLYIPLWCIVPKDTDRSITRKGAMEEDMTSSHCAQESKTRIITSASKIRVHYYGDGLNTNQCVDTRQGVVKKVTLSLPNRVKEFGAKFGFNNIEVDWSLDHLVLRGRGKVLMDKDINGESNEYIKSIVRWEWIE